MKRPPAGRAASRAATRARPIAPASVSMCAGVGEQRQRRGEQAADDLDDHEPRDERERDGQPAGVGVGRRRVVVMAVVVVAVVVAMAAAHDR